jgi:hypothetical protein
MNQNTKIYPTISELIADLKGDGSEEEIKKNLIDTLNRAYDIRKVELDLYWKRATYFWGFLIAAFTAYFIVMNEKQDFSNGIKFLVICLGFTFSNAWYLVNRGSSYWLTHWERIIDAVEEYLGMNLYKVNLIEKINPKFYEYKPYSVSRINIIVSFYIWIVWGILGILFLLVNLFKYWRTQNLCSFNFNEIDPHILIVLLTTAFIIYRLFDTKSGSGQPYSFYRRNSNYQAKD